VGLTGEAQRLGRQDQYKDWTHRDSSKAGHAWTVQWLDTWTSTGHVLMEAGGWVGTGGVEDLELPGNLAHCPMCGPRQRRVLRGQSEQSAPSPPPVLQVGRLHL
jgi:hypothetical protein